MRIWIEDGLAYATATLVYAGKELVIDRVILDTGSVGTVFAVDTVSEIGLLMAPQDPIHRLWGVGGTEFVFGKSSDSLVLGELAVEDFTIQVGAMDYSLGIKGIIGMDFFLRARAIIDLDLLEIRSPST
ncbi:MAG: retropepsin-like domain-containing protein [Anaerolineae bacterium]|nr:retropepsin-like domain-containing protein [Anaerolineae bacterium]